MTEGQMIEQLRHYVWCAEAGGQVSPQDFDQLTAYLDKLNERAA